MFPRQTAIQRDDTHRLIPARYSETDVTVLARIADDKQHVRDLFELESATNDRLLGEANRLPGITVHELVFGVPNFHIVNAAFTHPKPMGSRFNTADRGAWYAGLSLETAQREVAYHYAQDLREINWQEEEIASYRDFVADFRAEFHDLRPGKRYALYLDPDSYKASQKLAVELLQSGSAGIVYPSVRHRSGTCIACFRPALVTNVRAHSTVTITFASAFAAPVFRVMQS
ncbi:MAG TPA: RES family NAD+ phosphorylase [Terriglobales bacterium]